jgi:hypothetical protein
MLSRILPEGSRESEIKAVYASFFPSEGLCGLSHFGKTGTIHSPLHLPSFRPTCSEGLQAKEQAPWLPGQGYSLWSPHLPLLVFRFLPGTNHSSRRSRSRSQHPFPACLIPSQPSKLNCFIRYHHLAERNRPFTSWREDGRVNKGRLGAFVCSIAHFTLLPPPLGSLQRLTGSKSNVKAFSGGFWGEPSLKRTAQSDPDFVDISYYGSN